MDCGVESPEVLSKRRRAKWFAIVAMWSPFFVFIFTCVILASLADKLDQPAVRTREMVIALGGVLAAGGLLSGWRALWAGRSVGYKGVFGRALFGLIANSLLLFLAILGVGAFIWLGCQLEKANAQHESPSRLSFEAATVRLARTVKTLNRLATNQHGDAALVAAKSSEFLVQLRMLGDDFAAKTKLINLQLASNMADATSKADLQAKEKIPRDYLETNDRFAAFAQNRNEIYRQELIKAGVSSNSVTAAMNAFISKARDQKPWDANHNLGQAQLACLQFLETNWGRWSYTNGELAFQTKLLEHDYTNLQMQVTQAYQERLKLQHRVNSR